MELPQSIIDFLDLIPLQDLEKYVHSRYAKITKDLFTKVLESTDGDYVLQASVLKDLKPEGL